MIRILYMSDLHLEMERPRLAIPGWADFLRRRGKIARHPPHGPLLNHAGKIDLVVMAGDIHKGYRGVVYAHEVADYLAAPVVMVAGNHEFYHHDIAVLAPALRRADEKTNQRVRFLENQIVSFEIGGRRLHVLGATLWTDYRLHGDPEAGMMTALARMNDHKFIHFGPDIFTPTDAALLHEHSRDWLHRSLAGLQETDPGSTKIVVTHHAPSGLLLGRRQGGIAPAYASDILAAFAGHKPDLWIHGHTHFRHDSTIDGIHVVSAPRGYVGFEGDHALSFRPGIATI